MKAERADLLIVGAGPSGCSTAISLASNPDWQDGRIVMLEQDIDGASCRRAELLSASGVAQLRRLIERQNLEASCRNVRAAEIWLPSARWRVEGDLPFVVADRARLQS